MSVEDLSQALSAVARVFLEAFRGDSWIIAGGLRGAQVIGLTVLALCLVALRRLARQALEGQTELPQTASAPDARRETAP